MRKGGILTFSYKLKFDCNGLEMWKDNICLLFFTKGEFWYLLKSAHNYLEKKNTNSTYLVLTAKHAI